MCCRDKWQVVVLFSEERDLARIIPIVKDHYASVKPENLTTD